MRQTLAAAVLVAIAAVAVWLWLGSEDVAPPTSDPGASRPNGAAGSDAEIVRTQATPSDAAQDVAPSPTEPAIADPPDPVPTPAAANLLLNVRSAVDTAPIASFRHSFRHATSTERGEGGDGTASLLLPPAVRGELVVEADGHVPFQTEMTTPAADQAPLLLDVFLQPAAKATGIEITAADLANSPITAVRVEAWRLPEGGELAEWRRGKPLWSRRTKDPAGRFVLPELPPGDYGVRLLATGDDGTLLPLLPFARTFSLTGSNGFVEHVVLEPGCVLGLELLDRTGLPIDPSSSAIQISLQLAGGPEVSRRWVQQDESGRFAADDAPPRLGLCWLDEAVEGGLYRLTIRVAGELRYDQQIALRRGERQPERIMLQ